jgi:hypothetical protein
MGQLAATDAAEPVEGSTIALTVEPGVSVGIAIFYISPLHK